MKKKKKKKNIKKRGPVCVVAHEIVRIAVLFGFSLLQHYYHIKRAAAGCWPGAISDTFRGFRYPLSGTPRARAPRKEKESATRMGGGAWPSSDLRLPTSLPAPVVCHLTASRAGNQAYARTLARDRRRLGSLLHSLGFKR